MNTRTLSNNKAWIWRKIEQSLRKALRLNSMKCAIDWVALKIRGYVSTKNPRNLRKGGWKLTWIWKSNLKSDVSEWRKASLSNGAN